MIFNRLFQMMYGLEEGQNEVGDQFGTIVVIQARDEGGLNQSRSNKDTDTAVM